MGSPSGPRTSYWGSISVYGVPSAYSPVCSTGVMTMVPSTGTLADGAVLQLVAERAVRAAGGRPPRPR